MSRTFVAPQHHSPLASEGLEADKSCLSVLGCGHEEVLRNADNSKVVQQ